MNEVQTKMQWLISALLGLTIATLLINTCALDRMEQQVIRNTKALEAMQASGGGGVKIIGGGGAASSSGEPGTSSGLPVTGWNGSSAEVLYVEGAAPGAPLMLSGKPRPQGDHYVNRQGSPPGTLNPFTSSEGTTRTIASYTLGKLIEIDPDSPPNVMPGLAMEWEISEDKLTYTYRLRKGVQFADGRPFTSADVKFTFDVMRDPEVKAEHMRPDFEDVVSLTTPDDHTVVVQYRKKYWKGLYTVGNGLGILNKGWYEEQIPSYAKKYDIEEYSVQPGRAGFGEVFNKIRVPCPGTGPYYFTSGDFDPEQPLEMVQNPFHWGIQVRPEWYNFSKLRWIFIADDIAAFEEFRKQKFDISVVDFQPWDDEYSKDSTITDVSNYYEYDHMGIGFSYINWNTREAPFDDPRVRRAMTHLTNRQWIMDEIERGRGSIASFPTKPTYDIYSRDIEPIPFDIEAARALLAEAGWTDSDGDGVLDRDGERFEFEFKVPSGRRFYVQVSAALEDACKQVGIRMTTRPLEWSTFIQDYYERNFDGVCLYNGFSDPWIDLFDGYHSSGDVPRGGNASGFHTEELDQLMEDMREEFDDRKRREMFHRFNRIFHENQPQTLLVHGIVGVLMNNRFENVKVRPTGMRIHDVWVEPENVLYK